jgi:SnoaL-like polyketide cyclase
MTGSAYHTEPRGTIVSGENSRIAHQIVNTFVTGDTSALEDLVAVDAIDHNTPPHGTGGRAGLIAGISSYRATFSDLHVTVEQERARGMDLKWRASDQGSRCHDRHTDRRAGKELGVDATQYGEHVGPAGLSPTPPATPIPPATNYPNLQLIFDEQFTKDCAEGQALSVYGDRFFFLSGDLG